MLYRALKKIASVFFNILNILLAGNLPPFGCVCVIVEAQDRYLALERPGGTLVFPGGFMRWKEQTVQTAQREGKEETGLDLRIGEIVGYYSSPTDRFDGMSTLTLVYLADVISGELRSSIEGCPCWLDENELHVRLHAHYQQIFNDYLRYRKQHQGANVS